ncbi:hypothetical protein QBC47DRAFT_372425 [Echria macrotheca]|uniref:Chromo domain-containing protein n=1 Tax=Echria macrotheca TaxID=438768 RepID=A0AAJ0BJT8_9PEZI|nr:hypothetical protein QBC47DRAFT_372425 [Echria macrotheca]
MPPAAISDGETSGVELDANPSATKKSGREKKKQQPAYKDDDVEDEPAELDDDGLNGFEDEDEEGEAEEPEEYVVERIMSHMIGSDGEPLFEVKWEGYEKKSDRTWEPEDNLKENASQVLEEYLESIGGREKLFEETASAMRGKKRGRPSSSTPQASGKRTKRSNRDHPSEMEIPLAVRNATWKPPAGSWEDHIAQLDACEDEESGKLMVYLTWKNGHKTQHETSIIYQRCPQKMLQFYERHVRIIKRDPEEDEEDIKP